MLISSFIFDYIAIHKQKTESYKAYTILDKLETDKYDYNIYRYNGIINIKIDGKEYFLKEALLENKITMKEIIEKANKDKKDEKITAEMYKDGGTHCAAQPSFGYGKITKLIGLFFTIVALILTTVSIQSSV